MSIARIGKRAGGFCRLFISCGLRVGGCGLGVAGCGLGVASWGLRVGGCELGVASWGLRVGGCGLERLRRSFRFNPGDEVRDLQSTVGGALRNSAAAIAGGNRPDLFQTDFSTCREAQFPGEESEHPIRAENPRSGG
jgi:hypothetical protein